MRGPRTLLDVLNEFEERGYRAQLRARPGGVVECDACSSEGDAAGLDVAAYERLEGASDPADMMLVVAARCPSCEEAGTLVLTYGPMAPAEDSEVEARLELD